MSETKQPKDDKKEGNWCDKPVEREADKNIKEAGSPGSAGNRAKRTRNSWKCLLPLHPDR